MVNIRSPHNVARKLVNLPIDSNSTLRIKHKLFLTKSKSVPSHPITARIYVIKKDFYSASLNIKSAFSLSRWTVVIHSTI